MGCAKTKLCVLLVVAVAGCGVRETVAPDGTTSRDFFVGAVPQIDCAASPGHSASLVQLGAWISANNAGAGYHRARYFCGAPHCQLTLWADDVNRNELEKIAAKYHGVCIANKQGD